MRQVFYRWFGYRFIYLGMSTRNPGRIKIGIARDVKLRWRAINRDMRGWQFPIFSLPCFNARWFEGHLHRVMRRFNRPVEGNGGSEFFTYVHPLSWIGWIYVVWAIIWAFLVSHLLIWLAGTALWCWYAEVDYWSFQQSILNMIARWIGM